jgi:hypothetical protein
MRADQAAGSIVTLMCDSGARYTTTYDDDAWLAEQGIDIGPYLPVVEPGLGRPGLGLPIGGPWPASSGSAPGRDTLTGPAPGRSVSFRLGRRS